MNTETNFNERLESLIAGINERIAASNPFHTTVVRVRNPNAKYIALDRHEFDRDDVEMTGEARRCGVYCFVASCDSVTKTLGAVTCGDVLKAASYKVPAKHARGNIFAEDNGLGCVGPYGVAYLR